MNKQHQDNYINRHDKLLGDIDRIRLKIHNETQGMSPEEELMYHQNKITESLKSTGFVYEINSKTGISYLRDKGKVKYGEKTK